MATGKHSAPNRSVLLYRKASNDIESVDEVAAAQAAEEEAEASIAAMEALDSLEPAPAEVAEEQPKRTRRRRSRQAFGESATDTDADIPEDSSLSQRFSRRKSGDVAAESAESDKDFATRKGNKKSQDVYDQVKDQLVPRDGKVHVLMLNLSMEKWKNYKFRADARCTEKLNSVISGMQRDGYKILSVEHSTNSTSAFTMIIYNVLIVYR